MLLDPKKEAKRKKTSKNSGYMQQRTSAAAGQLGGGGRVCGRALNADRNISNKSRHLKEESIEKIETSEESYRRR